MNESIWDPGAEGGGGCSRITIKKQEFLLYFFIRYHETCTVMEYRIQRPAGGGAAGRPYTGIIADTHYCVIDTTVAHNSTYE